MVVMQGKIEQQRKDLEALVKEFQMYKQQQAAVRTKLVQELGTLREEMKEKKDAFALFLLEKRSFEEKLVEKETEIKNWMEKTTEMKENALMLGEEMRKFIEFKEKYERLNVLHEDLKKTLNKLETGIKSGNLTGIGAEMIVSLDDPLFKKVREEPAKIDHTTRLTGSRPKPSDPPSLDPSHFSYLRPSFAFLITDIIPENTPEMQYEPPFSGWLECTIRGILDSKYYEHLSCTEEQGRSPSRMADFVYGWMGHFTIDENTRQIRQLERWQKENADRMRLMLLLGVKHEMAKRVWEISTFRELLLEELTTDELSFYLHCRFLLFDGPQLALVLGRMKPLHYVSLVKARDVVDVVMAKLPEKVLGDVKAMLSEHTRNKHDELQIEASLVLRVMLEYYRKEKVTKYKGLKQLFSDCENAGGVDFFAFRTIVENIKWDLSEVQLSSFFRDCWTAGSGQIDLSTFLLVSNEHCYFQRSLRLKGIYKEPPLGADNMIAKRESLSAELMSRVYDLWQGSSTAIGLIKEGVVQMGQPELVHVMMKVEGYIKKKGQSPPEEYYGWSIYDAMRHLYLLILRLDVVFGECNAKARPVLSRGDEYSNDNIIAQLKDMITAADLFVRRINAMRVERFALAHAARRIQRRWRKTKVEKSPQSRKPIRNSLAFNR